MKSQEIILCGMLLAIHNLKYDDSGQGSRRGGILSYWFCNLPCNAQGESTTPELKTQGGGLAGFL